MRNISCCWPRQGFLRAIVVAGLSLAATNVFAAISPWQNRVAQPTDDTRRLNAPLRAYRALNLDVSALHAQLDTATDRHNGGTPLLLDLPMPDGTKTTFAIWRTQVMAPALAARYPQIRSFAGYAVVHPEIAARLDDSPLGFSAMIRAPDGVTLLQPTHSAMVRATSVFGAMRRASRRNRLSAAFMPNPRLRQRTNLTTRKRQQ